jgi:hypothetical protein
MGRFCILCAAIRPNEAFGGKGRRARICRKCRRLPREQQAALLNENEMHGFLEQSHISKKNVARLRTLAQSDNERIAKLAAVMLEVARFAPYRHHRTRNLARERHDVLRRMEEVGLILPRPVWEDAVPCDDNPSHAWDEWVHFANGCTETGE